jgi:SAM-dependent methyltransferase
MGNSPLKDTLTRLREVPGTLRRVAAFRDYVHKPNAKIREYIARLYLSGEGIEIGALHSALATPGGATTRFVDRMTIPELQAQYPDLDASSLMPPDIVDDAERLAAIDDETQDFVIANHFLEHTEDPIGTIENLLRVLKPGGIAYLAVPDKRFTFDSERDVTEIEHLKRDHEAVSPERTEHFKDWALHVEGVPAEDAERAAASLIERNYSIHYHVWTQLELLELLVTLRREYNSPFDVELFMANDLECVIVLRKSSAGNGA